MPFNIQGKAGTYDPFQVASSTNTSLFIVKQSGNIGIGSSTPTGLLTIQGTSGSATDLLDVASSTNSLLFQLTSAGRARVLTDASSTDTNSILRLGSTALSSPSSNGTYLGLNALSSFTGNLMDLQVNGASKFKVDSTGNLTLGTPLAVSSGGTGQSILTAGNILYGNGTSGVASSSQLYFVGNTFNSSTTFETNLTTVAATSTNLSVTSLTSGNCVQAGPGGILQNASGACGSGTGSSQSTSTIQTMFQGGSWNAWTSGFINASTSILTSATTTNLGITSLTSKNCLGTDSNGVVIQGTCTGTVTGTGKPLYVATWNTASGLTYGTEINDGTLAGINATSSAVSFNIQGTSGAYDPFQVTSSSGTSLFIVKQSGNVGIGTSTTISGNQLTILGSQEIYATTSPIVGTLSSTTYAGAGWVRVVGRYAYMTGDSTYSFSNTNSNNLSVIDVQDPANPKLVGQISTTQTVSAEGLEVVGNYAYVVGITNNDLAIIDISNPASPKQVGSLTNSTALSGAEGIAVSGKYAYITGNQANNGPFTIVDISDPANPFITGTLTSSDLNQISMVSVKGKYAYVPAGNSGKLVAIDISNPYNPVIAGKTGNIGAEDVYLQGKYAYVLSTSALKIVDISNPTSSAMPVVGTATVSGSPSLWTIKVAGKFAYVTNFVSSTGNVFTFDVSSSTNPLLIASSPYTINKADDIFIAGDYAYVTANNSSGAGGLTILRISGINAPGANIGNLYSDDLNVGNTAVIGQNLYVQNGINVGPLGILSGGPGVFGTQLLVQASSSQTNLLPFSVLTTNSAGATSSLLALTSSGLFGVGSSSPTGLLTIQGTSGSATDLLDVASSTNSLLFQLTSAGRARVLADASSTDTNSILRLGSTALSSPSSNGTYLGLNALSSFTGNFVDFQSNGTSEFKVDSTGNLTLGAPLAVSSGGTGSSSAPTVQGQILADNGSHKYGPTTLVAGVNVTITTTTPGQITITATGGAATAGGAEGNIQYNTTNVLQGSNNFNWLNGSNTLVLNGTLNATSSNFTTATATNLSVTAITSGNCVQAGPGGILQSATGACGSGQSTSTIQTMFQGGSYNLWTSGFINASTSVLTSATSTNFGITSLTSKSCLGTDSNGMVIQGTCTATGTVTGTGKPLYVASWSSASALTTGALIDDGTLVGVNATSSAVSFNVQGQAGAVDPFRVASSTGTALLIVKQSGNVGIGTTTPGALLTLQGTGGQTANLLNVASSTGTAVLSVSAAGNLTLQPSVNSATAFVLNNSSGNAVFTIDNTTPAVGDNLFTVASSTGTTLFAVNGYGILTMATTSSTSVGSLVNAEGKFAIGDQGVAGATNGRIWFYSNSTLYRFKSTDNTADYSEFFYQQSAAPQSVGTVMTVDNSAPNPVADAGMARLATSSYDANLLGVITNKGTSYNNPNDDRQFNSHFVDVGMLGHVAVKIATSSVIHTGDFLTSSNIPGVAMKATRSGMVLGQALADFDPSTSSGSSTQPTVLALVKPGYQIINNTFVLGDQDGQLSSATSTFSISQASASSSQIAMLINQAGVGSLLQLQQNGENRLLVQNDGAVSILANATSSASSTILSVVNATTTLFAINAVGDINTVGHLTVGKDTAGTAIIKAGDNQATVAFAVPYDSVPKVAVTVQGLPSFFYGVATKTPDGFTIQANATMTVDTMFDWIALAQPATTTSVSSQDLTVVTSPMGYMGQIIYVSPGGSGGGSSSAPPVDAPSTPTDSVGATPPSDGGQVAGTSTPDSSSPPAASTPPADVTPPSTPPADATPPPAPADSSAPAPTPAPAPAPADSAPAPSTP